MTEMATIGWQDCWLTRVRQMEGLLNLPRLSYFSKTSGKRLSSVLKSKFDRYWIDSVNEIKTNSLDNNDHNKLRVYKTFKSSFTREPYINLVRNRNQRSALSRLRVSSHNLAIELGRQTCPVTPVERRICTFCKPDHTTTHQPCIDNEFHFLTQCNLFTVKRNCLYGKMSSLVSGFKHLSDEQKFVTLLSPTTSRAAKLASKFIKEMFEVRKKTDIGQPVNEHNLG